MHGPSPPVKADSVSTSSLAPLDANSRLRVSPPQGPVQKLNVSSNQRQAKNMGVHIVHSTYHPSLAHSEPLCLGLWLKWVAIGIDHPEDPRHLRPILPRGEVVEPELCTLGTTAVCT